MKDNISVALKSSRIQMLAITIVITPGTTNPGSHVRTSWCQAEEIARRATTDIPTLKYVKLNITFCRDPLSYWTVTGEDTQLQRVHSAPAISQIAHMFMLSPPAQLKVSSFRGQS